MIDVENIFFLENLDFFSSKRKNHTTSKRATARYTHGFCTILLLKSIYAHRRMRSTYCRATHVISFATQMTVSKLKKSSSHLYFGHFPTCHMAAPNSFGSKKYRKNYQNFTNFFFLKNRVLNAFRDPVSSKTVIQNQF